jgi:hypothetical protein
MNAFAPWRIGFFAASSRYPTRAWQVEEVSWRMSFNLRQRWEKWCAAGVTAATHLLQEPALLPRATSHGLDLPVLASPAARWAAWLFVLGGVLYALELLLSAHWLAATVVAALLMFLIWQLRRMNRVLAGNPRRLLLAADGRIHVLSVAGMVEQVHLHPASMRFGPWMLLLLVRDKRNFPLLVGPDNTQPQQLAALRRRLLQAATSPDMPFA